VTGIPPRGSVLAVATLAAFFGLTARSGTAQAQVIAAANQNGYADRIIGGVDKGPTTRSLNPYGVNYADCIDNVTLQIPLGLSGFTGQDEMQAWATYGTDCVFGGRGTDGTAPTCWLVDSGPGLPNGSTPYTSNIPVRALVGPENVMPAAGSLQGALTTDACVHQPSYAGVPVTIWFLPIVAATGEVDMAGQIYQYPTITADLVGPPPPSGVTIGDGDTLFNLTWNPSTDGDTQGYDVFIDPGPGSHPDGGQTAPLEVLYCPDSGGGVSADAGGDDGSAEPDAIAGGEAGEDAPGAADATDALGAADATVAPEAGTSGSTADGAVEAEASTTDAGAPFCVLIPVTGVAPSSAGDAGCTGVALLAKAEFSAQVLTSEDGGAGTTTAGIAGLTCQNLIGGTCSAGSPAYRNTSNPTVIGSSASSLTISGLTNGATYNVVVAGVDGSGNVGPQSSPEQCDFPAPIDDFYKTYRLDGGSAGGGFCSLEAVGEPTGASMVSIGLGALAFVLARRRGKRAS
jgi:hypothetical protein